jgi:hypothetical protein
VQFCTVQSHNQMRVVRALGTAPLVTKGPLTVQTPAENCAWGLKPEEVPSLRWGGSRIGESAPRWRAKGGNDPLPISDGQTGAPRSKSAPARSAPERARGRNHSRHDLRKPPALPGDDGSPTGETAEEPPFRNGPCLRHGDRNLGKLPGFLRTVRDYPPINRLAWV